MRILGIDIGQARLGVSCVEFNGTTKFIDAEVFCHPRDSRLTFNEYLNEGIYFIADKFPRYLHEAYPDFIIAEIVPTGRLGSNSELNVSAATVCKTIAWQWGVPWKDIAANSWKKVVLGNGKATKAEIKNFIFKEYPLLAEKNDEHKKVQKKNGERATGYPQDLYDSVAIALAGRQFTLDNKGNVVDRGTKENKIKAEEEAETREA